MIPPPLYQLRPLIQKHHKNLRMEQLSRNPRAIHYLETHCRHKISWKHVCRNPAGVPLLEKDARHLQWLFLTDEGLLRKEDEDVNACSYMHDDSDTSWLFLASNPNARHIVEQAQSKQVRDMVAKGSLSFYSLTKQYMMEQFGPGWIDTLTRNDMIHICQNPHAFEVIDCLFRHQKVRCDCFDSYGLFHNPSIQVVEWILAKIDEVGPYTLLTNWCGNPTAFRLYVQYNLEALDPVDWIWLSSNAAAGSTLLANRDKVHWRQLCSNTSYEAIALLDEYLSNPVHDLRILDWDSLSSNIHALYLLEKYPQYITWWNWELLSSNPDLFVFHFIEMRQQMIASAFYRELVEVYYHPRRHGYYLEKYNYDIGSSEYVE
jgi:hypothetical protein